MSLNDRQLMSLLEKIYLFARALLMGRKRLEAENEALQQQFAELRLRSSRNDSEGEIERETE